MGRKLSKQDAEQVRAIVERLDDPRLRYFFLMLGNVIADRLGSEKGRAPRGRALEAHWITRVEQ